MATKKIQIIPPGYTDVCYPQTIASAVIEETNKRFMTDTERTKLSGVATGATNTQNHATNGSITVNGTQQVVYAHPTADGDKHVPATGTTNNGRVLKAGATAGSLSWGTLTAGDVGAVPTTRTVNGKALSANISITAGDVSAYSKAEIDGKIVDNLTTGGATNLLSAEQGKVLNSAIGQIKKKSTDFITLAVESGWTFSPLSSYFTKNFDNSIEIFFCVSKTIIDGGIWLTIAKMPVGFFRTDTIIYGSVECNGSPASVRLQTNGDLQCFLASTGGTTSYNHLRGYLKYYMTGGI